MATIIPSIIIALHLSVGWAGSTHQCGIRGRVQSVYVNSRRVLVRRGQALVTKDGLVVTDIYISRGCATITSIPARVTINYS